MPTRRLSDCDEPPYYFVTTTVRNWAGVFRDSSIADAMVSQIEETRAFFKARIVGYVLMPDHLHLLTGFHRRPILPRFMQALKSLSSRRLESNISETAFWKSGELWMRGYDELAIVSRRQFETKLKYIHDNPVRAGLVESAEEYPYCSAASWAGSSRGIVKVATDLEDF